MLTRNKKESKLRQTGLTNFLNGNPITKYLVFVMFFLVLALLIAINSPKQNFIKTLASNFFSGNTPIKEVEITTEDYDNEGSIKITKEAHWISKTEAELNLKLETIRKTGDNKKDIVLVFDVSASMEGEKLDKVKEDASELINYVLEKDEDNKVSIISFASTSRILSPLTNDKSLLLEAVNNMHTEDATNYYLAYKNVEIVLDGYVKESGKDLVVLFMTDGAPTINSGATTSIYESLKETYPYITINAVEYEMGDTTNSVNDISDNQWTAKIDSLNNVLFEATVSPEVYEKLNITDYINDEYFEIENEDDNKIEWNFRDNSFITGSEDTLKIKLKLKEEYQNTKGLYPTNKKLDINYKISEESKTKSSTDTPILKNNYDVYYDVNTPTECNIEEIESENHFVFDKVTKKDTTLSCAGYEFKGWDIEENVSIINNDTFIMPESDVHIRAIWTRQSINKSMDGKINEKTTLYKVVENEAKIGTYAKEYIGEHADAYDRSGTEKIYHYATTSTNTNVANQQAEVILNKFNVIFGGFCWQILRTTDTGGVKLIYNGVPDSSGTCNNTGTAQQIGTSMFNPVNSVAHVGYMYNNIYNFNYLSMESRTNVLQRTTINQSHYFAREYEYNQSIANRYKLYDNSDTDEDERFTAEECIANGNCNEILTGAYTFNNQDSNYSSTFIRYVVGVKGESIYYLELRNGQILENVNPTFYVGDKYIDNGDGTYTIKNEDNSDISIYKKEKWVTNYIDSNNKIICVGNNPCTNPVYIGSSSETLYYAENIINNYVYGNDFDYVLNEDTNEYEYVIKDTDVANKKIFWNWYYNYNNLDNNHYSCFNTNGICKEIKYIYYTKKTGPYYIILKDGKSINEALIDMLEGNNLNNKNSSIKTYVDEWYNNNMTRYTNYLEDTVFCNERSVESLGGWNPNGGSVFGTLLFREGTSTTDLNCAKKVNRFSLYNEDAKLEYPIGLANNPEINLLANDLLRYTGQNYWLISPSVFDSGYGAHNRSVDLYGRMKLNDATTHNLGVRPVVSLKPGTEYVDGDGSKNNPYIVDTSEVDNP